MFDLQPTDMPTLNFAPLGKALDSLDRALARALVATADEELRDACIQRFEYSFEFGSMSWIGPILMRGFGSSSGPTGFRFDKVTATTAVDYQDSIICSSPWPGLTMGSTSSVLSIQTSTRTGPWCSRASRMASHSARGFLTRMVLSRG